MASRPNPNAPASALAPVECTSLRVKTGSDFEARAAELMRRFCVQEEEEIFRQLFEFAGPKLLSLMRLMIQQHRATVDPSELLTDMFAQIYRARHTYRNQAGTSFVGWALTIAQNLLRQDHRERDRRDRREQSVARSIHDCTTNPFRNLVREESRLEAQARCDWVRRQVVRAFHQLTKKHQQVLLMHSLHGLNYQQIGAALNITPSAVAMRMKRARQKIARLVAQSYDQMQTQLKNGAVNSLEQEP